MQLIDFSYKIIRFTWYITVIYNIKIKKMLVTEISSKDYVNIHKYNDNFIAT